MKDEIESWDWSQFESWTIPGFDRPKFTRGTNSMEWVFDRRATHTESMTSDVMYTHDNHPIVTFIWLDHFRMLKGDLLHLTYTIDWYGGGGGGEGYITVRGTGGNGLRIPVPNFLLAV